MFKHQAGSHVVEVWCEECYTPGASDNTVQFDVEHGNTQRGGSRSLAFVAARDQQFSFLWSCQESLTNVSL